MICRQITHLATLLSLFETRGGVTAESAPQCGQKKARPSARGVVRGMTLLYGCVERREPTLLARVDVRAAFDQQPRDLDLARGGRAVQGRHVHRVPGDRVDLGTVLQQRTGGSGTAEERREMQRAEAVRRPRARRVRRTQCGRRSR